MSDKIHEALEARKLRKKKAEESFDEKEIRTEDKISSALKARESRIKNNLQTTFNDLESRISKETEALKKASTTSWGIGNDGLKSYLESTRQNRINLANIISEVDAYRKYLGDEKTDTLLDSLKGMENTYNTLTSLAEFRSKYDSEEEYQKDYDEAVKAQKDYEALTNFDLNAGRKEIDGLLKGEGITALKTRQAAIKEEMKKLGNQSKGAGFKKRQQLQKELNEVNSQIREIENQASQKKVHLNRAKYIQEGIKITEEAKNAEDFDTKSQYVSTKADGFWDNVTADILGFNDSTYEYINNIDGYRSKYKDEHRVYSSDNPFSDGESSFEEKGYDYITEDEIKIYNYYYSTEGKEKAEKFLDSIQESLSYRKATERFGNLEGNTFLELLFGVEAGLDQFESGMKNLFNTSDDYIPQTSTQMISGMVREDLDDDSIPIWYNFKEGKWEDKVLGSSLGQVSYDLINTTSNMLPSILTSTAIGFINPVAGQVVGAGLMGASASGNAYAEMLNLGYDKGQARLYSSLVGASEATLQYLLGGIGKLGGGKLTTEAVVKIANNMDNALARVAIKLGANAVGEFAEEYLQEVLNPLFKNMTLGTNEDVNLFTTDALYSGILGALSAGILEGGSTIASDVKTTKLGKSVQKIDGGVERLKKLGTMFSADSVAYQIADKVTGETGAYKIGLLLQEAGATLSEQNVSDITTELTKKGMDEGAAKKIARSYQSFLNEEMSLTDEQVEVLEGLDPLADVLRKSIIGRNTDVYQRTREYNDLVKIATEEVTTPQAEVETTSQTFAPYSNEYIDKVAKEYESMGLPTEMARAMAMAQLSTTVENETTPAEGKLSPTKENAVESEYEVSADGKTVNNKTDKIVNVKKITEITKSGEAKLALDDGTIVKASDLSFGTGAEALFVENISKVKIGKNPISTTSANTLYMHAMKALEDNPNMSADRADSLIRGFIESYIYGAYNFGRSKLSQKNQDGAARLFAGELTQEQRKLAYELGVQDRASEVEKDQKFVDELKVGGKPGKKTTGKIVYEDGIDVDKKALTDTQKINLEGIELLAKISSVEFHLFLSENSGNTFTYTMSDGTVTSANGWYVAGTNEIWIDLNAGNAGEGTMIRTAAHEISHYIKEWSPVKWQAMAELLVKDFSKKGVDIESMLNEQIDKIKWRYKKNKETMPSSAEIREMAYEEFVSDALSDMLTDGSIVKFMAEVKAKDHTLWQKIKDAIKSLLDKWGLIIDDYKGRDLDTFEAQALSRFEDVFKQLQTMYQDAFMDANEAYSAIGNVTGGETKNSTRSVDSNRKSLYNEYQTNAMQWAYSAATKVGDTKMFSVNGKEFALLEATEEGFIEIVRGNYKEVKNLEQQYREPNDSVYVYTAAVRNAKARYPANNSSIKNYREYEQGSRQTGSERLQIDTTGDNEHLRTGDKRKSKQQKLNFSLRDDVNQNKVKRAYSFAKSRDLQLIKRAEEYESKNWSRESIFKETGLVRDPKGIWIYELDDRKMKFYPMGDARKKNDPDYKEYLKYENMVNSYPSLDYDDNGDIILTEEQEKVVNRYFDLIEILEEKYGIEETLKDYVVHDELFKKYPQLGDAKFYISDLSKWGYLGYYDSQNNLIRLDQSLYEGGLENYTIESVVIHEIQHALQTFDERQNGSNKEYWNVRLARDGHLPYSNLLGREPKPFEAYLLTAGEIEAREAEQRRMYGDFARKNVLPNLFWDSALYPDKELVSAEKDNVKYSMRTSEYTDSDYLEAVNRRDVKSLQQMVDAAARAAGYTERLYHQTGEDFTEFNTDNQKAGKFDYELPEGIFLKPSDKDIGLSGKKQMELYTRLQNPLHFGTRYVAADYWKRNIQGYADVSREITNIDRNYSAKLAQAQNETRSYISEWKSSHSKTPSSELYKDIEFQRLYDLEDRITEEWEIKSNEASLRAKGLINEFVSNGEYDGVIIDFDQGSGGRFTKTYITFDSSQLKSADLVTYDNNGNIIPLSERFKSNKTDIRFSQRNYNYNETQFNNFGWVRYNNVLSSAEYNTLISRYADYKHNKHNYPTTRFGEAVIFSFEYPNILMYVKGNIKNPQITKILRMKHSLSTEMQSEIQEEILHNERRQLPFPYDSVINFYGEEVFSILKARNYESFRQIKSRAKGRDSEGINTLSEGEQDRARSGVENQTVDKFGSNEIKHYNNYDIRYSDRDSALSNRSILANSLESAAQNDIEKNKLAEYKEKISRIELEEQRLSEIQKQLFTKGAVEPSQRKDLQFEAKQIANRINTYDRQLLKLEAAKPLQNVLTRERALAMKKQKQKYNESLARYKEKVAKDNKILLEKHQESRKKAIEGRAKTAMRHKIQKVVSELNQFLLRGTKDKHVMIGLQKSVAEALDAVNMDTVGADERVAKYNALIAKAKDPDVIASFTETRDRIQAQGDKLSDKLSKLKDAYNKIKNSEDPLIANSYDEVIASRLEHVQEKVGNTALRDMTLGQLEDVYDMYKMVLTTIRNSNKAFKNAKNESITTLGNKVMKEVEETGGNKRYVRSAVEGIKKFGWNSLKPAYAFKVIGSNTFTEIYNTVRAGEDTWATDVSEAKDFYQEKTKKYNYDSWDFKAKYSFESTSGKSFELTLEQIMSLYAYSKREQADLHLRYGGFVLDSSIEITQKSKLGIPLKYKVNTADAYNLSIETLGEIVGKLTEEQKAFVDEMQDYLSTVMGEKGNEVSLEMYGVKLFKEKNYFPLKSAKQFMFEQTETAGEVKIKNAGFSKETVPKANNPIILNNFTDVWASHVNEMSMYHSFVLPLEDFNRVFNYKTHSSDSVATESVEMFVQNAYGKQAVQYIKQLLTDLNGGARVDSSADWINKSIGLFKKAGVFASASVVIQQPSALARAWAYVNPKYFVFTKMGVKGHQKVWNEVKKYAPIAIIKEMGRFDTHVGQQTNDWIKSNQYEGFGQKAKALFTDSAYRDDVLSKAPAIADEIAWCYIWNAIKKETKATSKLLEGSEEFLKKCGERFTEVITLTQVYDSVLSRSGHMRSKDTGMKMATAFMAEPTTAMNMLLDAYLQGKRGNKNTARKIVGGVVSSIILNSILVSLVYAARDDDDDETYTEKYLGSLTAELIDGFNPLTYIPFVKDLWSIGQGYNVERSDMSIYSKLWQSVENLFKEDMSGVDKAVDFAGSVANIFGLPLKNIARDTRAIFNVANGILSGTQTTRAGMGYSITDSLRNSIPLVGRIFKEGSNSTKLYDAIVSGDQAQINRVKGLYKDNKAIESAIKKGLRENDSRIKEAAKARIDGDVAEYTRIVKDIKSEGYFSQDTIVASVNAEINAINKGKSSSSNSTTEDKESSIYKIEDYYASIVGGDQATAYVIKEDLINIDVANGKDRDEAEDSFNSKFASHVREQHEDGYLSGQEARRVLVNYGEKSEEDANSKVQYWEFKQKYPDYDDLSEEAVTKYYDKVEPYGVGVDVYYDYSKQRSKCKGADANGDGKTDSGSVKAEILQVINSLPLTYSQKDALYYLNGWSSKTIYEAPWR